MDFSVQIKEKKNLRSEISFLAKTKSSCSMKEFDGMRR